MYLLYWAPFIAVYQLTNRFPLVEPHELPYTALDRLVPFVPALLPLYVAYIPFYWWTVVRSETDRALNRVFYATHVLLLVSVIVFVTFPVRMPREQFYGADAHGWADVFWRWFDAPNNCFPSLHVATSLLLVQLNWPRPYRLAHTALGLGIAASTVFVKQHYVADVAGGVLCYLVGRWFLARLEVTGVGADGALLNRRAGPVAAEVPAP